ncbi:GATA zinc finger [Colletotrichum higginsianum IMI 349063]|uniref:GATA zinc finger n=2 Tax=Colletotrichum higginsianum TaxID=80884 RepID=A0A1B7YDL0_COLHI|nr:GATA zinc finger [Colletotrichum higginsianum IMI 349063]OBR09980.1 GATA zinc finger [Colletotrichum higginsianum IMI 349063]TID06270.1 Cutinase gene palindrome-binding protein [Colletotrichum higginsianum]
MSHGPPQPPPASLFGFGPQDAFSAFDAMAEADPNMMSSLLDPTVYGSFDAMSMSVDNPNDDNAMSTFNFAGNTPMPDAMGDDTPSMSNNYSNNGDDASSIVGGGPPPAGGMSSQAMQQAGSTLTEFTKRRNWPAKVVEELKDFLQILDANGRIRYVSPSILNLTGYTAEEIADTFLKDLVHPDDVGVFVAELNESIASGNPLRLFFRFKKKDGKYAIFESVGHAHIAAAKFAPNPHNQSPFCQAVFMMSRPYPTKNAGLLDSFLEHKIENERLRRRIAELRREEDMENEESQRQWMQSQEGRSDMTPSETTMTSAPSHVSRSTETGDRSSALNVALTREALEGVAGNRPDSLKDKMARYEGTASHTDTIEMLTGLRYIEGERSRGITTGNASPTLIKGDAGIAIPLDRDPRTGDKKKKLKTSEEYVCTDCGTLDSPEWRKGPSGPKTLCNACGLRWAKKEKKNRHSNSTSHQPGSLQVEHGGG